MLSLRSTTTAVLSAFVFSAAGATAAHAADPDPIDKWARWQGTPRNATVRSLDFIGPLLFAGTEDDGVYTSPLSVGPWTQRNDGLLPPQAAPEADSIREIKTSPDGQVYAATSAGLFRSPAGQGGWTQVGGGAGARKLNMGGIQSIMFNDPTGTDMTVAVAGAAGAGVYFSSDGGAHWDRASGMQNPEAVYHLAKGPAQVPMYAAADNGVYASANFGRSWLLISDGIAPGETTLRVAVSPTNASHLYASTSSSVYFSNTAGATWKEAAGSDGQTLPSGGKRAFLLTPGFNDQSLGGNVFGAARALVGTERGVYGTIDNGAHWKPMSPFTVPTIQNPFDDKEPMRDRTVWSLNLGFTTPTIMAGTAGFGVYNVLIKPLSGGNPAISSPPALKKGSEIKISNYDETNDDLTKRRYMDFQGMKPYFFDIQWYRCITADTSGCTEIAGAKSPTYTVPEADANNVALRDLFRYRAKVTARNMVSPNPIEKWTPASPTKVAPPDGSDPYPTGTLPSLAPHTNPGPAGQPAWGSMLAINKGTWRTQNNATPTILASAWKYRWDRCNAAGSACTTLPTETKSTYTITKADIGFTIKGYVGVTIDGVTSDWRLAGGTNQILNRIPLVTAKPLVVGDPWIGRTVSGSVGGWSGHDMSYKRRWFRCNGDGVQCNPIAGQTGPTYALTEADRGSRVQLEVTVTAEDPAFDRVAKEYSLASAVVGDAPLPPAEPVEPAQTGSGPQDAGQQGLPQQPGQQSQQGTVQPAKPLVEIKLPKSLKVGAKLEVPRAVAGYKKLKFQWLRNGKKIKKATKRAYRITKADRGKKVSCKVTLTPTKGGKAKTFTTLAVSIPKK